MNRLILFFVMFLGINIIAVASYLPPPPQVEKTFTESFDSVFQNISRADATTGILYNRSIPFAQLYNFNSNVSSVDTSNSKHFMRAYRELYDAAFQSFAKLPFSVDSLRTMIAGSGNIVDIGILHYKFNTFDSAVAMQKLIIDTVIMSGDTSFIIWEDTTVSASLYTEQTSFVVSPLASFSETNQVTFRFNNDFYFDNTGATLTSLMVDFDDGQGLRSVSMGSNVLVTYLDGGLKTLRFVAI